MTVVITLSLGKRIRYAREACGMEQTDLARALRISPPAMSAWENDRNKRPPTYASIKLIAEVTCMPIEFFESDEMTFATIPDGGSPLTGVGAVTAGVTREYDRAPQVSTLRLAA